MAAISHREPIDASADAVWALVGSFGDDSWTPVTITCDGEGEGAIRTVTMPDGAVVERCEHHDPVTRTMRYSILEGNPFPTTGYLGTIKVEATSEATSELDWSATYEVTGDADTSEVDAALLRFLRGSARTVKRHLEGTPPRT